MTFFEKFEEYNGEYLRGNISRRKALPTEFEEPLDIGADSEVEGNLKREHCLSIDILDTHPIAIEAIDIEPSFVRSTEAQIEEIIALGQLAEPYKHKKVLIKPDTSQGLGKQEVKRDLVKLEEFVRCQILFTILDGKLCAYKPPCWIKLDDRVAKMVVRSCLEAHELAEYLTAKECGEIYKLLLIDERLERVKPFREHDGLINLLDGTLEVMSNTLQHHDPEDGFFTCLNITYSEIQTPPNQGENFERFATLANQWHPTVRTQLLELIAFGLIKCQVKHFYALLGPTGTGKSQIGRFLRELVGKDNVMNVQDIKDFGGRFTCGSLADKKIAMCLDLGKAQLPNDAISVVKQIVGDDAVKGEKKYQNAFTFDEKPLLLFAGNYKIRIPNAREELALIERLVIVPIMYRCDMEEEVDKLYKTFLFERGHIIAQALDAYRAYIEKGRRVTRVPVPEEFIVEEGNLGLRAVEQFLSEECTVDQTAEVETTEFYYGYKRFAGNIELSEVEFSRLLSRAVKSLDPNIQPIKRVSGNERRGYRGLSLNGQRETGI